MDGCGGVLGCEYCEKFGSVSWRPHLHRNVFVSWRVLSHHMLNFPIFQLLFCIPVH